jgi:hypothetical protein
MTRFAALLLVVALSVPWSRPLAQNAAFMAEVQQVIESATAQNLPADAVRERVAAGFAFNSDPARILSTARREVDRLLIARRLLGPGAPGLDITAGAKALSVPVPESSVTAVRKARPTGSVSVPLGILSQLIEQKANPKRATDWLVRLMQRQATDVQLTAAGDEVGKNVRERGLNIDAALDVHMRYVAALPGVAGSTGTAAEALNFGPTTGSTTGDPGLKSTLPPTTAKPPGIIKRH